MSQTVRVRQGDCMAPVIFLFMVMAFTKTLEKVWVKTGLQMVTFRQQTHSPRDVGRLTGYKNKYFEHGTLLALFCVFYVDNGTFPFENCKNSHVNFPSFTHTLLTLVLRCKWGEERKSPKPHVSSFLHQGSSVRKALCLLLTG